MTRPPLAVENASGRVESKACDARGGISVKHDVVEPCDDGFALDQPPHFETCMIHTVIKGVNALRLKRE